MAKKKKNKLIYWLSGAVLLLIILVIIFKKDNSNGTKVTTSKVERRTIIEKVSASGKIYPEVEVVIIPEISGEIVKLYVDEGDSVQKGDPLVDINPNIYQDAVERAEAAVLAAQARLANSKARYSQAQAQFEKAKLDYDRNKQLFDQKVISQADFDAAETAFKVAQAEMESALQTVNADRYNVMSAKATLREARNNLTKTTVFAPMSGIVTGLAVEEGKVVGGIAQFAATEMMRISNLHEMEARVDVSENDILNVRINDTAEIEVEAYPDRKFMGLVYEISSSANTQGALSSDQATNFTVKIRLLPESYQDLIDAGNNSFPFLPGMSTSVEIITQRVKDALSIPIECVTVREDLGIDSDSTKTAPVKNQEYVFLVESGKAKVTPVKTGIQDDEYIEILSGLEEGAEVISGPYNVVHQLLREGDPVRIDNTKRKKEARS